MKNEKAIGARIPFEPGTCVQHLVTGTIGNVYQDDGKDTIKVCRAKDVGSGYSRPEEVTWQACFTTKYAPSRIPDDLVFAAVLLVPAIASALITYGIMS